MHPFNRSDFATFITLKQAGVLQGVEGHRIDQRRGAVMVMCPDGDQFDDAFKYQARLQKRHRTKCRIHPITRNGGTLRLVATSRTNKKGRTTARDLLDEIKESLLLKKINVVILYVHAPCGKARKSRESFLGTIRDLFEAKRAVKRLRRSIPRLKVACFYHIDFGPEYRKFGKRNRRLTYFASREMWRSYLRKESKKSRPASARRASSRAA